MRAINFELEEEWQPGHYGPSTVVVYRTKRGKCRVLSSAGTRDDIDVFREGDLTYVLVTNSGLDYVGLEAYDLDCERVGDVFFQNDYEIAEALGPRGLDLKPHTIVRRLAEYIY